MIAHTATGQRQSRGELLASDLNVFRCAHILVKQHGQDAPIHAAMRADELLEAGDLAGFGVFKRVVKATAELLSKERPPGVSVQ